MADSSESMPGVSRLDLDAFRNSSEQAAARCRAASETAEKRAKEIAEQTSRRLAAIQRKHREEEKSRRQKIATGKEYVRVIPDDFEPNTETDEVDALVAQMEREKAAEQRQRQDLNEDFSLRSWLE